MKALGNLLRRYGLNTIKKNVKKNLLRDIILLRLFGNTKLCTKLSGAVTEASTLIALIGTQAVLTTMCSKTLT